MREQVKWFAEQMEQTLKRNDHKGGWDECTIPWLFGRLNDEVNELGGVESTDHENLIREATDVANFAMMIADKARRMMNTI